MSAKPILYSTSVSPPGRTVELTAKAIGLNIDFRNVDLINRETRTTEFLKLNPQHTIPVLDDNGKVIWDSHAISAYLVDKFGKDDSLYPKDLYLRARVDQRLHFDSGVLFSRIRQCMTAVIFLDIPEYPEGSIDGINEAYNFVEEFLKDDLYMVGNNLTIADFACATTLTALDVVEKIPFDKYPKMKAWFERLAKLPYYDEVNKEAVANLTTFYNKKFAENKVKAGKK